ncbi:MTOR-associated protein MEAK7 isoform X2 [Petromyzon marinus]|uniref:MTOR-associated protein MEAK7 isoform X2 n=1 Tax=Petromyzon marinus TaxID=7757 RepID=UPI003F6E781F
MGNAMGGGGAALQQQLARFRPEERATLSRGYDSIAHTRGPGAASTAAAAGKAAKQQGPGEGFNVAALRQFVQPALPEVLLLSLFRGMSHAYDPTLKKPAPAEYVCQERFVRFVASVLRGGAEEQAATLCWMVGERNGGVASQQVHQLVQELLEVAVQALHHGKLLRGWQLDKMADTREGAALVATALLAEIRRSDGSTADTASGATTRDDVSGWLHRTPLVPALLSLLVTSSLRLELGHGHNLLPLPTEPAPSSSSSPSSDDNGGGGGAGPSAETPAPDEDPRRALAPLLVPPACEGVAWSQLGVGSGGGGGRGPRLLLDVPSMLHLGVHLPGELRDRWRLLFSSRLQGESFSRLCGLAVGQGPTLLLVEDVDGHLFGGFASASWEVKPQFQGSSHCFLFSLRPSVGVYSCTGYNDHYMYLNHGQQTMPNGLGMGGQHDYFGLWLDSDYGRGHSRAKPRCTTYGSPQLSAREEFSLSAVEVWGLGSPPERAQGSGGKARSVLDADPEVQAMLEMAGKVKHSDGLREPKADES